MGKKHEYTVHHYVLEEKPVKVSRHVFCQAAHRVTQATNFSFKRGINTSKPQGLL